MFFTNIFNAMVYIIPITLLIYPTIKKYATIPIIENSILFIFLFCLSTVLIENLKIHFSFIAHQ